MDEKGKPKIGQMLRGQAWVELHGQFIPAQLRALAEEIEKNCRGLERKYGSPRRPDNQLGGISENN